MIKWLKSLFSMPEPIGPPQTLRAFTVDKPTITRGCIHTEIDLWRINSTGVQTVRLFDVENPDVEHCMLTYRMEIKTEGMQGRAFLEMWCSFPGQGEFFSKGFDQAVSGTTDWARYEIPFYLKKGQRPDLIKLNLVVEGTGTVWLRNVELLKTPLSS